MAFILRERKQMFFLFHIHSIKSKRNLYIPPKESSLDWLAELGRWWLSHSCRISGKENWIIIICFEYSKWRICEKVSDTHFGRFSAWIYRLIYKAKYDNIGFGWYFGKNFILN